MTTATSRDPMSVRLRRAIVLSVQEGACDVFGGGLARSVRYAPMFPSPRIVKVLPGHLVAVAVGPNGSEAVVWRWYDAVVLGAEDGRVRLWEPSHGEVEAQSRDQQQHRQPGTRAYLSAGLPGADWWVAGPVGTTAEDADVDLDEVDRLYTDHDLWASVF